MDRFWYVPRSDWCSSSISVDLVPREQDSLLATVGTMKSIKLSDLDEVNPRTPNPKSLILEPPSRSIP